MGTLSPDETLFYIKEIESTNKKLRDNEKGFLALVALKARQRLSLNEELMKKLIKLYERVTE